MMPLRALTGGPPRSRPQWPTHWPTPPLRCPQMRGCPRREATLRRSCRARYGRVVERDPALVFLAGHRVEPRFVVEIPAHGTLESRLECLGRGPAKLTADLGRIDRVTAIMPRAIFDECDLRRVIAGGLELA